MADKNTDGTSENNNKHKKKISWIGILFILFLLIFEIGDDNIFINKNDDMIFIYEEYFEVLEKVLQRAQARTQK